MRIAVTNAPPGSAVYVDDKQIADIDLGKVEVDPGTHVVELRIVGKAPVRAESTMKDGDKLDVPLTVVVAAPPPPRFMSRSIAARHAGYSRTSSAVRA